MSTIGGRARAGSGRVVRVLLVDDSSADRIRFGRALAKAGYDVQDAEDGTAAWQRLQEQQFDVVVSDRQMPGTDGIELIRLCRANPQLSRLPVIMVSAMDAPSDARPASPRAPTSTSARAATVRCRCCSTVSISCRARTS
jgi:CheY-like chemotaxis protein